MTKKIFLAIAVIALSLAFFLEAIAAEKLKFATSVRVSVNYYLPVLAAEEKGFWKQNGLEVEWVPFRGGAEMYRAVAAGEVGIGFTVASSVVVGVTRGIPVSMIASLVEEPKFLVYVAKESRFKKAEDLKGAKVGVPRLGAASHFYGLAATKALGLEKEVKFLGVGGITEAMAALKMGSIDAMVEPLETMVALVVKGEVREVLSLADYLPKDWIEHVIFARKDTLRAQAEVAKRAVKSVFQALAFIQDNPRWTLDKMKSFSGFSEEAARMAYDALGFSRTGKVNPRAVESIIKFSQEYGLIAKERVPAVEEVYIPGFTS